MAELGSVVEIFIEALGHVLEVHCIDTITLMLQTLGDIVVT